MSTETREYLSIDWLTLATWDFKAYLDLVGLLHHAGYHLQDWRPRRWMQYKGQLNGDNLFYGLGEQKGQGHGVIKVSGGQAHIFADWFLHHVPDHERRKWYATRLDLQSTKTPPDGWNYSKAYQRLKDPKKIIRSTDGETLYVGARTSDSFWRIYDKTETMVRVELELKGKQAQAFWLSICQGSELEELWNYKIGKSRLPKMIVHHYQGLKTPKQPEQLKTDEDLTKKLDWLQGLDGLVYKLAHDHDTSEEVADLIKRWYEYTTKP